MITHAVIGNEEIKVFFSLFSGQNHAHFRLGGVQVNFQSINRPCMHENRLVLFDAVISSSNINGVSLSSANMRPNMRYCGNVIFEWNTFLSSKRFCVSMTKLKMICVNRVFCVFLLLLLFFSSIKFDEPNSNSVLFCKQRRWMGTWKWLAISITVSIVWIPFWCFGEHNNVRHNIIFKHEL